MFLWNDTWLISGKSFSTWQQVMKFLPEGGNWQFHSTSSADTECKSEYLTLLLSKFWRPFAVYGNDIALYVHLINILLH